MISKGNATWNTTENLNHQTVFELWNVFHVFGTIFGQCEFPKYRTNCWSFGPAKTVVLLDPCCFCWSRAPVHQAISKTDNIAWRRRFWKALIMLQNFYKNVVGHWDSIYYNCMSLCVKTQAMGIQLMSMKNMMGELLYLYVFFKTPAMLSFYI